MAKIRTDFVTNSSSSSFILGFKSEETMIDELKLAFPNWGLEHLYIVALDVENADKMNREDVIKLIRDEERWSAKWELERDLERKGWSWSDAFDFTDTEEGKKMVEEILDKWLKNCMIQINESNIFVEVKYSDHDNCELEQEIMPKVRNMIRSISHH